MAHQSFDAAGAVRFDLENGSIGFGESKDLALFPIELFETLSPTPQMIDSSRDWGAAYGSKLAQIISNRQEDAEVELLSEYVRGVLAILGFGRAKMEIRGNALLFRLLSKDKKEISTFMQDLVAGFLGGYLSALREDQPFEVLPLFHDVYFAGNRSSVEQVKVLLNQGTEPFAALDLLAKEEGQQ